MCFFGRLLAGPIHVAFLPGVSWWNRPSHILIKSCNVHVVSIAGKEGNPGMSPYNTSKVGMEGFVKMHVKDEPLIEYGTFYGEFY